MIPYDNIVEWRATTAPWVDDAQVEQDLILSRAVVSIFNDPWLHDRLAFRGGTVLHKCLLAPAARYLRISEQADHRFRSKPITHFGGSRSPLSVEGDQGFRSKPISRFGGCRS